MFDIAFYFRTTFKATCNYSVLKVIKFILISYLEILSSNYALLKNIFRNLRLLNNGVQTPGMSERIKIRNKVAQWNRISPIYGQNVPSLS